MNEEINVKDLELIALAPLFSDGGAEVLEHVLPKLKERYLTKLTMGGDVSPEKDTVIYLAGKLSTLNDIEKMIKTIRNKIKRSAKAFPTDGGING